MEGMKDVEVSPQSIETSLCCQSNKTLFQSTNLEFTGMTFA